MIDPGDRPPLSEKVQEEIEAEQKALHDKYWPQIREFNVPVNFFQGIVENHSSPPIRQQRKLFRILESYATALFDAEARRYPRHPKEHWLSALAQEVINTITARLRFVDLNYHAEAKDVTLTIMEAVRVRHNAYMAALGPVPLLTYSNDSTGVSNLAPQPRSLWASYRKAFPEVMILDVCWAAKQRYREWMRWIGGTLKDGSKPDRCFRAILVSGKRPQEYRKEPRPKNWK
jgi:hypothetical protein